MCLPSAAKAENNSAMDFRGAPKFPYPWGGKVSIPLVAVDFHSGCRIRGATLKGHTAIWHYDYVANHPTTPWSMILPQALFFTKKHAPVVFGQYLLDVFQCSSMLGPLQAPCGLGACRRRFCSSKSTPLDFWSMYLLDCVIFHQFEGPPSTPWSMSLPQALFCFLKKHAPGILEHVSCGCCQCS